MKEPQTGKITLQHQIDARLSSGGLKRREEEVMCERGEAECKDSGL
jgi:hypothetical protein